MNIDGVLDRLIGFIDTLYTVLCIAIAHLHTLQFIVKTALRFSVFTSPILATDFLTVSLSLQITHEAFFSQRNSFLAIIL
jgi:hypothetical protein